MLSSEPYLYQSVISCSNVLKLTKIKPITNNHYYVTMSMSSEYTGFYFTNHEIKQCCHFFKNKCKIFKMLVETLFLRLFEPDCHKLCSGIQKDQLS